MRTLLVLGVILGSVSPQKPADLRLDHGSTPTSNPRIAAHGDAVYAAWLSGGNVWFNRSADRGSHWHATDARLNHVPGTVKAGSLRLATSGDAVFAVWADTRNGTPDIFFNASPDGGVTWRPSDHRVNTNTAGGSQAATPQLAVAGSAVYVAWQDGRNGNVDIYFNRSLDRGATWLAEDLQLDTRRASGSVQIAAEGSAVYVVWLVTELEPAIDLELNRSLDRGATWLEEVRQVNADTPFNGASSDPRLAVSGSSVYVVWEDLRTNSLADVYLNRSLDQGSTWLANDVRINTNPPGASSSKQPRIAAAGSSVYVAWSDDRPGVPTIYFNRSIDRGTTWLTKDRFVDSFTGFGGSRSPALAVRDSSVWVAWSDQLQSGRRDLHLNRSRDGGASWLQGDVRVDTGTGSSRSPAVALTDDGAYVAWSDDRSGRSHVRFNVSAVAQPFGTPTPGAGGLAPRLTVRGATTVGATPTLELGDGRGGAPGALLLGLGSSTKLDLPFFGGRLLVQPTLTVPIFLGGTTGAPGAGRTSWPLPLPALERAIGANFNFQAVFYDVAAPFSLSMSNGVEIWIG